jgi:uncharacterized protein
MPNALAREKSPYLLQHAENPVDWLPWGEGAFAKARMEQKPIFLSIGYSTCHWCHVMAHESFENAATAAILNEYFVSVKVDREERPDVDKVYMTYVQTLTGHGGWPLSAWLTPELKPFYGGTYYPPDERHGRPGFPGILRAIARGWQEERDKLVAESERVIGALAGRTAEASAQGFTGQSSLPEAAGEAFEKCFQHFYETADPRNGGFGGAPKFPRASNLNFLFRVAAIQGLDSEIGSEAVRLAVATLRGMAQGGIHDHVGGGYHRYSVDGSWFVPHFEKMLYDQAQIAMNCVEARQATGEERFAWLARDIFDYVRRDLTSPEGGFYTAEDADSLVERGGPAHAEGAFYVWTAAELRAQFGNDFAFFAAHYGVRDEGNVARELDSQGEFAGKNILMQRQPLGKSAADHGLTLEVANEKLVGALAVLRGVRARRPRPLRDDKILTANNGLMISALARAHSALEQAPGDAETATDYLGAAKRAAAFIERELYDASRGVLFRSWREGRGATEGFAEDYAAFIQGLLDLYEASFQIRWLQWAFRLQGKMDELFWDEAGGGYFNSAASDASIVLRLKEDYDGAEPAPSSVAAMNLLRLAMVFDPVEGAASVANLSYRERARRCLAAFQSRWVQTPQALPQMMGAVELALSAPRHAVIAGDPDSSDFRALAAVLHESLGPRRAVLAADGGDAQRWLAGKVPWLAEMKPVAGRATVYLCEEFTCRAPVQEPKELRQILTGG